MKHNLLSALIAGSLAFCACTSNDSAALEGKWNIETMTGIDNVKAAWKQPTITFDTAKSIFSGVAGANLLNGGYEAKDGNISFGEAAMTRMMADSITMVIEMKYVQLLSEVSRYRFGEDGCLILSNEDGSQTITLSKQVEEDNKPAEE